MVNNDIIIKVKDINKRGYINNEDILNILKQQDDNAIDLNSKILLENIDVLCNYIDNKNIKKFLNLFELRNCRVFLDKGCKDICRLIESMNSVIYMTYITYVKSMYDKDLTGLNENDIKKILLSHIDLRDLKLPSNPDFFRLVQGMCVKHVKLPDINFHNYNLEGVNFLNCNFSEGTIFPDDFFQKLKNKTIVGCKLPPIYINSSCIQDCSFKFTNFHKNTIFSNEKDLFKSFNLLYGCKFPSWDYTKYDFNGVNLSYCTFPENSILPYSQHLVDKIIENNYPKHFINKLHLMHIDNLDMEEILMKYGKYLNESQKLIIYHKLNNLQCNGNLMW